jgi:D-alanyl-D-alanine dipeptidase
MRGAAAILRTGLGLALTAPGAAAGDLPAGFARLREVAPEIRQEMRYATSANFTGRPVPGYRAGECILAEPAAKALAAVERDLAGEGFGLVAFDCYRPARAVRAFVAWAEGNGATDPSYHPDIPASRLIAAGYIAARSGHSSGGSVDVGLRRAGSDEPVDMGSSFDFFGPHSHAGAKGVGAEARANRERLARAMTRHGFEPYAREWWHFRFRDEPFAGRAFDFEVTGLADTREGGQP